MKLGQKGFSAVEIILVVAVVGLIGAVGWLVYDRQQDSKTQSKAVTVKTVKEISSDTEQDQPISEPKAQMTYLVVKEWGVKVPQTPTGNVISYQMNAMGGTADFVSSEQKALGGSCGDFGYARYHVFVAENGYKSDDIVFQNKLNYATENGLVIKANGKQYYILGDMTGGDCSGKMKQGQSISQQEIDANNNLLTALKGLVAN